jgi:hypothetical protein
MRVKIACLFILMFVFSQTSSLYADFQILLKNGGKIMTSHYWYEKNEIRFYYLGGVVGIEKNAVRKIERAAIDLDGIYEVKKPEKRATETEPKAEKTLSPQIPPVTIDLKAYQDKMAKLKADINKTLTRIRKADTSKDLNAKDEATADNRKISAEMWKLTEELKEKNNGKLPADWWEGVGREEPATQ